MNRLTADDLKVHVPDEGLPPVKLIGVGGVGGIVARYGAIYLASLGPSQLTLIDGDDFEPKNFERMFFKDFGKKSDVVMRDIKPCMAHTQLLLRSKPEYVTPSNIAKVIRGGDIVMCCVDNHATRKMISDHVRTLANVCLISGGNDGVTEHTRGTAGNVQVHIRKDGVDVTPDLGAFHAEIESPQDKRPDQVSCTAMLASVPQMLLTNIAVASAMLRALWLYLAGALFYHEGVFDIAESLERPLVWPWGEEKAS